MKDKLDLLIRDVLQEDIDNVQPPSSTDEWEAFRKRYLVPEEKKPAAAIRPRKLLTACAMLLVVCVLFYFNQAPVMGAAKNVIRSIATLFDGTLKLQKTIHDGTGSGTDTVQQSDDPRIDEARKKVSFDLRVPGYLPEGYELKQVKVNVTDTQQERVDMYYENINGRSQNSIFLLVQQTHFSDKTQITYSIKDNLSQNAEQIKAKGIKGIFVKQKSGDNQLFFDIGDMSYRIEGWLDKEEMIKLAESMK